MGYRARRGKLSLPVKAAVEDEGSLMDVADEVAAIPEPVGAPGVGAVDTAAVAAAAAVAGMPGVSKTMYHFRLDIFTQP